MKKGEKKKKNETTEGIELPNQENIGTLGTKIQIPGDIGNKHCQTNGHEIKRNK